MLSLLLDAVSEWPCDHIQGGIQMSNIKRPQKCKAHSLLKKCHKISVEECI